jgi:hypothetical protein
MRVFPCSIQTNGTNRTTRDHIRNRKSMPCGLPPMD